MPMLQGILKKLHIALLQPICNHLRAMCFKSKGGFIMAQETVKAFFKQIEEDRNLSDQYKSLLKGVAETNADEAQATA